MIQSKTTQLHLALAKTYKIISSHDWSFWGLNWLQEGQDLDPLMMSSGSPLIPQFCFLECWYPPLSEGFPPKGSPEAPDFYSSNFTTQSISFPSVLGCFSWLTLLVRFGSCAYSRTNLSVQEDVIFLLAGPGDVEMLFSEGREWCRAGGNRSALCRCCALLLRPLSVPASPDCSLCSMHKDFENPALTQMEMGLRWQGMRIAIIPGFSLVMPVSRLPH